MGLGKSKQKKIDKTIVKKSGGAAPTQQKEYDHLYKLLLIGDANVGKTSLLLTFCEGQFPDRFVTSIQGDYRDQTITVDNLKTKLQIYDTAGQERFRTITGSFYRGCHGVLVCYDVTNKESFENVDQWIKQLNSYVSSTVSKVIVGLKTDLSERVITTEQGKAKAKELGLDFVECSAKNGTNVTEAFTTLVRVIKSNQDSDDD